MQIADCSYGMCVLLPLSLPNSLRIQSGLVDSPFSFAASPPLKGKAMSGRRQQNKSTPRLDRDAIKSGALLAGHLVTMETDNRCAMFWVPTPYPLDGVAHLPSLHSEISSHR